MPEEPLDMSHVKLGDRPLVVCDVDDVVLQFMLPFQAFLESEGHQFLPRSFRLHGNIVSMVDGLPLEEAHVTRLIEAFFEAQDAWQVPLDLVAQKLDVLSKDADVVFLTAMPPQFHQRRRQLLDRLGLDFPLLSSRQPKGPIVHSLHDDRPLPVAFVDDMAHNLHSVRDHVRGCLVIHLMPNSPVHKFAPPAADDIPRVNDWNDAARLIFAHIGG